MAASSSLWSWRSCAAMACALALSACGSGGGDDGGGEPAPHPSESYFPLATGDRWEIGDRMVRVVGVRIVDGVQATAVQARDGDDRFLGEAYYIKDESGVRALADPLATGLDATIGTVELMRFPLVRGSVFTQFDKTVDSGIDGDGDGRTEPMTVRSVVKVIGFEQVSTPAGTFGDCAHVQTVVTETARFTSDGRRVTVTLTGDDWYAPGIGLVKSDVVAMRDGQLFDSTGRAIDGYRVGGLRSDTLAPTVVAVTPEGSVGNTPALVSASFSEDMDLASLNIASFVVRDAQGRAVDGTVQVQRRYAIFVRTGQWSNGHYTATLTQDVTDRLGNPIETVREWPFEVDVQGPTIMSVTPTAGATAVRPDVAVTVVFSEAIADSSVHNGTVALMTGQTVVPTIMEVSGATLTLTTSQPLDRGVEYTVTVSGVTDLRGNPIATPFTSSFRTETSRFAPGVALISVNSPVDASAIGDVNGDGRPDVLLATGFYFDASSDFKLYVRLQQADGSLAAPVKYDTSIAYGTHATSINVVDVDGDGRNDVVLGEGEGGIEVFLQGPLGTLASSLRLAGNVQNLRVADLDQDGRPDLVGMAWGSGSVQVWWQQADRGYGTPQTYAVEHAGWEDMELGDVNGDGRIDVVITSGQGDMSKALAILPQQAGRTFGTPIYRTVDPVWGAWGVAIGDINGDGRNDIVASHRGNQQTYISVFRQGADGSIPTGEPLGASDLAGAAEISDMDGDGRLDIVVAHEGWTMLSLYRQGADGTLGSEERFSTNIGSVKPYALALGDVNGDGLRDVVLAGTLLLQQAPQAAAATRGARAPRGPWVGRGARLTLQGSAGIRSVR